MLYLQSMEGSNEFSGRPPSVSVLGKLSIHSSESIAFMESIGAPQFVLSILKQGLKLPFHHGLPLDYCEPNNRSAKLHAGVLREKVSKWLEQGYCHRVPRRPPVCSPLSVSSKLDLSTGETKLRPCYDASRHLNKYLDVPKVKISDLSVSEKLLEQGDYQTCFDLENQYFHCSVNESHHQYLGFNLQNEDTGEDEYYCFSVMIYGLSMAVSVVTRLTLPLMEYLNKRGVRAAIMIDDGRVLGRSKEEAWVNHLLALDVFQKAGWNIQHTKTSTEPTMQLYHQGFTTNTELMCYSIPDFKVVHLKEQISSVCENMVLRQFAKVVGKLISVKRAIGPMIRIMLRSAHHFLAMKVQQLGDDAWDMIFEVSAEVIEDMNFIKNHLEEYNTQPIVNNATGFCLNSVANLEDLVRPVLDGEQFGGVWASDSSESQTVLYSVIDPINGIIVESFTVEEQQLSSASREFKAVENTIERIESDLKKNNPTILYWLTDSQVLCRWLLKGSSIEAIRKRLVRLFKRLQLLRLRLVPVWLPREHELIVLADSVSKFHDTDDWGLDIRSFKILEMLSPRKFSLDAFANCTNKHVAKFYSKVISPGSAGVNAMMQNWSEDYTYACPPVKMVIEVFRYIKKIPCCGVLVVPLWPTNMFWPVITIDGAHLQPEFTSFRRFRPTVRVGKFCDKSYFKKHRKLDMLALYFDSKCESEVDVVNRNRCLLEGCSKCD